MKVSINWAQQVSNVDLKSIPQEELLQKVGSQLGAIEEVIDWKKRYDGIVVVKVVSCDQHPNADKLHVCKVDDGGVVPSVERDDNGFVQVVCGAPNVTAGMTAAWIPPGATVPSTLDKEPFVLGSRELRGVNSNGMLASAAELGISDNHDGILEILSEEVGEELSKPGTDFCKLYGLDDLIIDCENKMFTHRPDCFGILGVARELAGITHKKFESPSWYMTTPSFKDANDLPLHVSIETELTPRLMAVAMDNVSVKPSSVQIQSDLSRVGIRPINNVVDITNWLMHLTGQPLHAYDYDKVKTLSGSVPSLVARLAVKDEPITLLNGKNLKLDESTIVIATDKSVVGVAGAMGGADTEVDENTKSIIIEVASFDMYSIRKTAMKFGIFTDAVTRFNKGQSHLQNDRVMAEAMRMMHEIAGATQASKVFDVHKTSIEPMPVVSASVDFVNERLGSSLTLQEMSALLANVECGESAGSTSEIRSYLMGVGDIADKLERIGVKIVEKTKEGNYKIIIPDSATVDYEKLVSWELKPGFWNEYIGSKNVFLFKDANLKMSRYEVTDDTEHEIVEMCRTFTNEYYTSLEAMLAGNSWYKPLLPLKKGFRVEKYDKEEVNIAPPFWRRDLELPEDLVEEIGRLHGFSDLPVALPKRLSKPTEVNKHVDLQKNIRLALVSAGANEVVTYSFVHSNLLQSVGQTTQLAYHVRNALSPDLQYYRMSLTPSLLEKIHPNTKAGYDYFALFEMGRVHNKVDDVPSGEVPQEFNMLAFVLSSKHQQKNSAFYEVKTHLNYLASTLGLELDFTPIEEMPDFPVTKPFDVKRSAYVSVKHSDIMLGIVGEYRSEVVSKLKLSEHVAGFEIGTAELLEALEQSKQQYRPLLRFPKTSQDITLEVPNRVTHGELRKNIAHTTQDLSNEHGYRISLLDGDIYIADNSDKKRITFRLVLAHPDRTLTIEEVNKVLDEVSRRAVAAFAAVRI